MAEWAKSGLAQLVVKLGGLGRLQNNSATSLCTKWHLRRFRQGLLLLPPPGAGPDVYARRDWRSGIPRTYCIVNRPAAILPLGRFPPWPLSPLAAFPLGFLAPWLLGCLASWPDR